jgi:hypothetical protein
MLPSTVTNWSAACSAAFSETCAFDALERPTIDILAPAVRTA